MDKKKILYKLLCGVVIVALAVLLLTGLLGGNDKHYHKDALTGEDVTRIKVDAPTNLAYDGTINAEAWNEIFPHITASMNANATNDEIVDYLSQDPYLINIYEGFGFAKEYGSARGHAYTLDDVHQTARPHPLANCLTCKTPNFAKLVQDQGVGVYSMDFEEVYEQIKASGEVISCYTCHGNSAGNEGELRVTHNYVNEALGGNVATIDAATLSCGQCHIEYYFTPTDKETMMPYDSVEAMDPEAILAFYDSMVLPDGTVGFADWTQESTGARLLKAQHPERET